ITLEKNYRQQDQEFLRFLWKVRKGTINDDELALLNQRCVPISQSDERYVHLTSTKRAAENRNRSFLDRITHEKYAYKTTVTGNFSEKTYPTDAVLELKVGAKVMMVKNGPGLRWVNGTIGRIAALVDDGVFVEIDGRRHIVDK